MSPLDLFGAALGSLRGHRKRTVLSLFGMSIGVAAVIVLSGLGEGARRYLRAQFQFIGANVIGIVPGKVETSGGIPGLGGVPNDLTLADARALQRDVRWARNAAPVSIGTETIAAGHRSRQIVVFGSTAEIFDIRGLDLRAGRFLPEAPWERGSRVVVLSSALAGELFPGTNPLGEVVRVGGWRMRVIGVLGAQGVHFGLDMDETIFVPVSTALAMFDKQSLFRIVLQLRPGSDVRRLEERCRTILTERHGEEDFTITTPDAILDSLESILAMLTLGLAGIASISMCVAGIGIMNVMLVSVSERTDEIGLAKAIGAEPSQVLALFVTEAAVLSGLGALLGTAIGYATLHVGTLFFPSFPFVAPLWAVAAAVGLAVVVGTAFGLFPASKALRLDPVEALSRGMR